MKKLMWFLIGFCLVVFPMHFAYAETCGDWSFDPSSYGGGDTYVGTYPTSSEAEWAVSSAGGCPGESTSNVTWVSVGGVPVVKYIEKTSCGSSISADDANIWYALVQTGCTSELLDSDDDGIPDECDFYPDDSVKLNTYTVDWVTIEESTDTEVAWGVQTPYGDGFTLGDDTVDGSTPGYKDQLYYQTDGNWYELPADCASYSIAGSRDLDDKQVVDYEWTGDEYEDTPGPGTDGAPVEGTDYSEPTGSETDSEALQVIAQNTAAGVGAQNLLNENIVAGNSELNKLKINSEIQIKQGEELKDYLSDLNTAVGTLDTSVQAVETAINENMDVPQADIDSGLAEPSQSTTAYNDALLVFDEEPTLEDDAPIEYQEKTDLPTFFTALIDNNPIKDIITDTRIEATGAQSYLDWVYNGQTIKLDLGGYETQLGLFGNILLGIFTLAGFLLVFRGN